MTGQALQTEFEFTLPKGYVDDDGTLHREGRMRLATAADEIKPLNDPQVQSNSSYLTVILLSRVVTELGDLKTVDASVIEELFVDDLEYLQAMYERVNNGGTNAVETVCPDCASTFEVAVETGAHVDGMDVDAMDAGGGMEPTGAAATSTGDIPSELPGGEDASTGNTASERGEGNPAE